MSLTLEQKMARRSSIGASDAAAVLGLSPYKSPYDVWMDKTGRLELTDDSNEAIEIGDMCEDGLVRWATKELGGDWHVQVSKQLPGTPLSATYDAIEAEYPDNPPKVAIEAKTAGIMHPLGAKDMWGDDGTDQIPDYYQIQCQQQALIGNLELIVVPALIGGRGRALFRILPNKDLQELMLERLTHWWERHVLADTPPADSLPNLDLITRYLKREEGKTIVLPADPVIAWREANKARLEAERAEKAAKAKVLALMQDATIGASEAGTITITKSHLAGHVVGPHTRTQVHFKSDK